MIQYFYTWTLEINPKNAMAYYGRGASKIALGQRDSACADLTKTNDLGLKLAGNALKTDCK